MRQYDTGDDCMAPDNRGKVMGDMADFALDSACDDCEDYDRFASGHYSDQEAYDRGFTNEFGGEERGPKGWNTLFQGQSQTIFAPKVIKCNKCGSADVIWAQVPSGKWCLHTNGIPHVCGMSVTRTGPNSNKKELTGYKLITIRCCETCTWLSTVSMSSCKKHKYSVVSFGICNDWEQR